MEHRSCASYCRQTEDRLIESVVFKTGTPQSLSGKRNRILFILTGESSISFSANSHYTIKKGEMMYIPSGVKININALSDSKSIIVQQHSPIRFCNRYTITDLANYVKKNDLRERESLLPIMKIKHPLQLLLEQMSECIEAGLICREYLLFKVEEIFYMLRAFYTKPELSRFFSRALTTDAIFYKHIMDNYQNFGSVTEFASSMNYTVSGFEKRFFKTFGTSVYKWLVDQKAQRIRNELGIKNRKITDLYKEFNFSSASAFNDFCKKHLHATPGQIVRRHRIAHMRGK